MKSTKAAAAKAAAAAAAKANANTNATGGGGGGGGGGKCSCACADDLHSLRAAFQQTLEQHQAAVAAAANAAASNGTGDLEARIARLEETVHPGTDDGPAKPPPAKRARPGAGVTAPPTRGNAAAANTASTPAGGKVAVAAMPTGGSELTPQGPQPEMTLPPLLLAAQRGDAAAVRGFLSSGVRALAQRDDRGDTALHHAARAENPAALEALIAAIAVEEAGDDETAAQGAQAAAEMKRAAQLKADALKKEEGKKEESHKPEEMKKDKEDGPTDEKMEEGEVEEVRKVRAAGMPGYWLRTPLHAAAATGRTACAKVLLTAGATADARDADLSAPLHLAATHGHFDVVELLLDSGAAPSIKDTKEQTALHLAAGAGHVAIVKLLLNRNGKGAETAFHKRTPLLIACAEGHVDVVEALLDAGASIKDKDRRGYSALHTAAERGHASVVRLLLSRSAHPDSSGDTDVTPLYCAARSGHAEVVTTLLAAGADARRRCGRYRKESALAAAACFGHAGAVEALLRHGAADTRGEDVREALVSAGSAGVVWALASAKAAPAAFEAMGHIAMRRAAKDGQAGVVRALLAAGVFHGSRGTRDGKTPLLLAAAAGHAACVRALLDGGADPHWTAGDGSSDRRTALHEAAAAGHAEVVSALVKRGARIDAEDADGKTPLLIAAEKLQLATVKTLLRAGASPRFLDACKEEAVRQFVVELCVEQLKKDEGF